MSSWQAKSKLPSAASMNKELSLPSHIYQTKANNQSTNQSTKELTEGRDLRKSASRLPSACFAIPVLTASLGSVTDTLNCNCDCAYANDYP